MSEPTATPAPQVSGPVASLDGVSKLVALLGTAFMLLSVFYDFSFLTALGLRFSDVPTTISDHVRSAIVWAPTIVVFGGLGVVLGIWESEGQKSETSGQRKNWFERNQGRLLILVAVAAVAMHFGGAAWYYFAFIPLWLEVLGPSLARKWTVSASPVKNWLALGVVPALFGAIGGYGYIDGDLLLRADTPRWEVTLKSEKGPETNRYLGIRRFSSVAVLVDTNRKVSVVQSDLIQQVGSLGDNTYESLACRWLGQGCLAKQQHLHQIDAASSAPIAASGAVAAASTAGTASASK